MRILVIDQAGLDVKYLIVNYIVIVELLNKISLDKIVIRKVACLASPTNISHICQE